MNAADTQKLNKAVAALTNMDAHLSNMLGRSGRAAQFWADQVKTNKGLDDESRPKIKNLVTGITQLTKDAKVVRKDIDTCLKETRDAKILAKYATAKEFRDKVVVKRLATSKAFDQNASKFVLNLTTILGAGLWPGMRDVDPKVTVDSLTNFTHYFNELRIDLAKL